MAKLRNGKKWSAKKNQDKSEERSKAQSVPESPNRLTESPKSKPRKVRDNAGISQKQPQKSWHLFRPLLAIVGISLSVVVSVFFFYANLPQICEYLI